MKKNTPAPTFHAPPVTVSIAPAAPLAARTPAIALPAYKIAWRCEILFAGERVEFVGATTSHELTPERALHVFRESFPDRSIVRLVAV